MEYVVVELGMMQNMEDAGTELKTLTETKINGN